MGKIITFYSYKGGTGRSMALANVAWLLAINEKKVCVLDWDLEAPGLHRYFKPFLADPELFETDGLIDAFWQAAVQAFAPAKDATPEKVPRELDLAALDLDLEDYITPLDWDFGEKGGIDFVGAGRQGATYSERVNTFDWKRFYSLGGGRLLDEVRDLLARNYDYVLIDSRTGVSDTSGICTIQMPDMLVACFTLNRQSIDGAAAILRSVRIQRTSADGTVGISLLPIVTRIENSEKDKLELARAYARKTFGDLLTRATAEETRRYWDEMEVTYRPYYAYEEVLAAFGDTAGSAGSSDTLLAQMEVITRRITGHKARAPEMPEADRQRVRQSYAFGVLAVAPTASAVAFEPHDEAYAKALRNIYNKERLWRSSDYRYENLLSLSEFRLISQEETLKFGPLMREYYNNSMVLDDYRAITARNFYIFMFLVFVVVVAAATFLLGEISTLAVRGALLNVWSLLGLTACLLFLIFCLYVVTQRRGHAPIGIKPADAITLSLLGPFAPDIRDYDVIVRDSKTPRTPTNLAS
jgi:cellulose biosynthesis protein BcsQ